MKLTTLLVLIATLSISHSKQVQAQTNSVLEFAPINHLFVPQGFDDNDTTEVVVTGYLPNPCYTRPESHVRVAGNTILVRVVTTKKPGANTRNTPCADVVVPFTETVKVGSLNAGHYQIIANGQSASKLEGKIEIVTSNVSTMDDFPYAIVQYIEQGADKKIYLVGSVYSDCFKLDSIEYISNRKDVISVLPTLKQVATHCDLKLTPFRLQLNPPLNSLTSPYYLIHARSADGKSVNFVASKK